MTWLDSARGAAGQQAVGQHRLRRMANVAAGAKPPVLRRSVLEPGAGQSRPNRCIRQGVACKHACTLKQGPLRLQARKGALCFVMVGSSARAAATSRSAPAGESWPGVSVCFSARALPSAPCCTQARASRPSSASTTTFAARARRAAPQSRSLLRQGAADARAQVRSRCSPHPLPRNLKQGQHAYLRTQHLWPDLTARRLLVACLQLTTTFWGRSGVTVQTRRRELSA